MATRVSTSFEGPEDEGTIQQMPSAKNYQTSANIENTSVVEVRRGMGKVSVADASELQSDDVVSIDGVEVKASLAREMGLLGEVFAPIKSPEQLDPNLSAGAAVQQTQDNSQDEGNTGTGHAEYDEAAEGLNEAMDAGTMEFEEAQTYDTVLAQTAMSGMNVDDAVKTLSDLEAGTISQLDIGSENATMLKDAETKVTEAATKSAQSELGAEGFQWLQQAAQTHEGVNRVIREYAVDRARGRAGDITWGDLMAHIREEIGATG